MVAEVSTWPPASWICHILSPPSRAGGGTPEGITLEDRLVKDSPLRFTSIMVLFKGMVHPFGLDERIKLFVFNKKLNSALLILIKPSKCLCFVLKQTGGFMFPVNRPCPSTPQSLTPKMMQLRFGANSPRPSPFYSPSSNSVQHFRCVMMLGLSQICLICGMYPSAKFERWVYLWPGSLVRSSWAFKSFVIHQAFINFIQSLRLWLLRR